MVGRDRWARHCAADGPAVRPYLKESDSGKRIEIQVAACWVYAMKKPVAIKPGRLLWCGEHWIGMLRRKGEATDSAKVSLYHTRVSPAGEGTAALIRIPGPGGLDAIWADRRAMADWTTKQFFRDSDYFDPKLPVLAAAFSRGGDILKAPSWTIKAGGRRLAITWKATKAPVIAAGEFQKKNDYFTILYFADETRIELDGRRLPGKPYLRDIWKPSIGGDRSSCLFALAETLMKTG